MYYNYVYVDPRKPGQFEYNSLDICFLFEPFHIGKGKEKRYLDFHNRNRQVKFLLDKLRKAYIPTEFAFQWNFTSSEENVFAVETQYIKSIGRRDLNLGPLINFTDGG